MTCVHARMVPSMGRRRNETMVLAALDLRIAYVRGRTGAIESKDALL